MAILSSSPFSLAIFLMVNRWRGTSLTAMVSGPMIIMRWNETFFIPSYSVTMIPEEM